MSESETSSIEVGRSSSVFVWNPDGSTEIFLPDKTKDGNHYFKVDSPEYYASAIALLYAELQDPTAAVMRNLIFDHLEEFFNYVVEESEAQKRRRSFRLVEPVKSEEGEVHN